MKRCVLFVVPHLFGSMRLLATVLRHMDRTRFSATILALGSRTILREEFPDDVEFHILDGDSSFASRFAALPAIIRLARRHDLIVAYAELTPTYLTALAGWIVGRPVIGWMHIHQSEIFRHRLRPEWAHRPVFRAVYPRLTRVVGVGRTVSRDLEAAFGLSNVACIPNAVDTDAVRARAADALPETAADLFAKPVLLSVALLEWQKGYDVLIAAHAKLRAAGIDHTLAIAGDGSLANDLRALADRLGVADSVRFLGYLKNPYPVMARARGLVLASRLEGFALVVAEALALGTPVVSTRVAGPDEILADGAYGPLVPVDDVDALASAMGRLLTEDAWHAALARNAPAAAERYAPRHTVPPVEALFDEVLGTLGTLAPEFRLLCRAARSALGNGGAPFADAMSGWAPDWAAVIEGAGRHRAVALVLAGLRRADKAAVPSEVLSRLRRLADLNGARCLAQAAEVIRLAGLFEAAGIRVMVLKGVVLSLQLYGNLAQRGAGDIDLLVDPARFWDADGVLAAAGYQREGPPISSARRTAGQRFIRDLTYRHRESGALVELHQRLTSNPNRMAADFETLWRDRVEVGLGGAAITTLPRRVLPLYLCVHGAHHCWERLCWLADLAVLLKDGNGAAAALADAEAAGLGPAMRLALALGHDWLGLPLPDGLPADAREAREAKRFAVRFFAGKRWLDSSTKGTAPWLRREVWRRHYLYSMKGGWQHGWSELRADLVNPVDWDLFPLPDRLLWLYPLLRPVGWLVRNARRWRSAHRRTPPE
ncbi:nucleotidyltransferase family protein [Azospirillum sp. TSO22-1]|uniref:nucleotidyltransferase family protein n=1 Tax=Azospirillum sp. TSO22-1 TaxID=716789 RepID=UPI000D650912|nr:nucleotidyltransferase family protein [Azospirillum sp. TSO22-1]